MSEEAGSTCPAPAGDMSVPPPIQSDLTVADWIHQTTARSTDRVAVVDSIGSMTFGELEGAANRLARHLRSLGVTRGTRVAICLDRTRELLVSLLATWQAGAAAAA